VPVTRAGHTWWINFRANDLFLACSGFEQRVLSDHFDEATMTIDCRTARILSHRQNIQPYGRLLATQPMSWARVPSPSAPVSRVFCAVGWPFICRIPQPGRPNHSSHQIYVVHLNGGGKEPPLPWLYVIIILFLVLLFEVLPYLEEFIRGVRREKR
jgi:hypothetical protein